MRKKDETKRIKILDATAAIILREGAAAVSTTKVAREVGIAQSNVYLYFQNKDELLQSVYEREMIQVKEAPEMALLLDSSLSIEERINHYFSSLYHYALANPESLTLIEQIKFLQHGDEQRLDESTYRPVEELLTAGVSAGIVEDLPVDLYMTAIFSTLHHHAKNIKTGKYPESAYPYPKIHALLWAIIQKK